MKEQNTRRTDHLQSGSVRKYPVAPRTYTGASMTTEYQHKFAPPRFFSAFVPTSKSKAHYHQLKETGVDVSSPRSGLLDHKWIKYPPGVMTKDSGGSTSDQYSNLHSTANQKDEGISVYTYYFQPWKAEKRLPYKPVDNLKVNRYADNTSGGKGILKSCTCAADKQQAFESLTSYRSDYVAHPVLPRLSEKNTVHQKHQNGSAWTKNRQHSDEAYEIINPFKTCSLKESNSVYLSTMRADYTAHKHQAKTQPVLPPTLATQKSTAPFEGTTTMRESFKAWDFPPRRRLVHRNKTPQKGSNLNPCAKCAANTSSPNLTKETPGPVENGTMSDFKLISPGPEETHM